MKIELKPRKKETLTEEEIQRREREKAELLASLGQKPRAAPKASEPTPTPEAEEPLHVSEPAPEVIPLEPVREIPVIDVSAVTAERKALEAQLKDLEQQIAAAKLREKQAQQAAIQAQQAQVQAQGAAALAPLKPRLERHLAEVSRIQRAYGPTLKDFARSMASDSDPQIRRKIGEVYRAAAPLGSKLGDARATIESALKGLTLAIQSAQAHVHSQAATLAEAALQINLPSLEAECKALVTLREELRPGYVVKPTTPDRVPGGGFLPPSSAFTRADFGPSLT